MHAEASALVPPKHSSATRWFLLSAAAILALTGVAKIWSSLGDAKVLWEIDPILGLRFGLLMRIVGVVELVVAFACIRLPAAVANLLVAWLSASFLVYRLSLLWVDWRRPCPCLGALTDALHIPQEIADVFLKIVLAYLLIGSCGLLLKRAKQNFNLRPADSHRP